MDNFKEKVIRIGVEVEKLLGPKVGNLRNLIGFFKDKKHKSNKLLEGTIYRQKPLDGKKTSSSQWHNVGKPTHGFELSHSIFPNVMMTTQLEEIKEFLKYYSTPKTKNKYCVGKLYSFIIVPR